MTVGVYGSANVGFANAVELNNFYKGLPHEVLQRATMNINVSAADIDNSGPGSLLTPMFEKEIFDLIRRESTFLTRVRKVPATGQPHRYIDQSAIVQGAFTDPNGITPTPGGPTRTSNAIFIKAITAQSIMNQLDRMATENQGVYASVVAQDMEDILNGIIVTSASGVWNGNDTSLSVPTTEEYFGLLNQITNKPGIVASGASIIDNLNAQVARMVANVQYKVKPTAIYVNPILGDLLNREAKANLVTFGAETKINGVVVYTLRTQAGDLPIITEPYIPSSTIAAYGFDAPPANHTNYFAAILSENFIEMPFIAQPRLNSSPMLFQLGLTANLTGSFVGIKYDAIVAKGAAYAHSVMCFQAPTPSVSP